MARWTLQDECHKITFAKLTLLFASVTLFVIQAAAQYTPPPPPTPPTQQYATPTPPPGSVLTPQQLEQLVARIALYPDPLLAQILTASTYWNEIPEAAAWVNQHSYLVGDALADAIRADNLQFDPSVLALVPFPSILNMMAEDMAWTQQLGNAVLVPARRCNGCRPAASQGCLRLRLFALECLLHSCERG